MTLIGPNEKVNSKEFVSSEVDRLQGLLQENRQEVDILFGLHTEDEMLTNLERLIKGGMGEERDKFWAIFRLHHSSQVTCTLSTEKQPALHLVTLPAAVDRIQEGPRSMTLAHWDSEVALGRTPMPGNNEMFFVEGQSTRAIENRHYPFFRNYNRDFLSTNR